VTGRIAPALFDFIDEAQDDLRAVAALARPLQATSAIRQFYINFYAQFFENVLKADIDTLSQRDAARAGVLLKRKSGLSTEVRTLVHDVLEFAFRGCRSGGCGCPCGVAVWAP
jgi:hypothetical protein